jgi:protein subunit release factor A
VTDHRINFTSYQLEKIMDGEFEEFTEQLIKAAEEKEEQARAQENAG